MSLVRQSHRSIGCAGLALLLCSLIHCNTTLADGILRDGMGAISTGRGGTNLGFADNGNILFNNPGALVNINGSGLNELGLDVLFTDLTYQDPDNARTGSANNPFPVGQLSFIRKSADGNFGWGLGVFSQAGFSTKYELNGPLPFAGPQNYKSVGALMRILPGISVALTPKLSIGATLGVAVAHVELEGPHFTQLATPFQGTPTKMDIQGTGAGISWSVGMQYVLTPRTVLGASFQGESHIDLDGSTTLEIPGLGVSRFDTVTSTQWPASLGIGISHQVNRNIFSADVIWTRWSAAKSGYDMVMTSPTNPVFGAVLGDRFPERFPFEWKDSVAVRLGFQRFLDRGRVLRAGYVYHPNPIPESTLNPFVQAVMEHALSAGYGWQANGYSFDLAYQFTFGPDQHVGTSGFIGGDFNDSITTASAHWLATSNVKRF